MALTDDQALADIVAGIYRSAYDSAEWSTTIDRIRTHLHGSRACLTRVGPALELSDVVATNTTPAFQLQMAESFREEHELSGTVGAAPVGIIYRDHELIGKERLRRSRFWNEWMEPQDMYGGLAAKLLSRSQSFWILDVQRGCSQEQFSAADAELFAYVAPHLMRALEIARGVKRDCAIGSLLESLAFGVIRVDGELQIQTINSTAEAMLARPGSPLCRCRNGSLRAITRYASALKNVVVDACGTRESLGSGIGGDLVLRADPRVDGAIDLAVSVAPATSEPDVAGLMDRACFIIIRELSLALPPNFEAHARHAFDLTAAEAKVASALAAGQTLKDVAVAAGISHNTVRTHLYRIFRKTETRQQSELVALLKSIQPFVRSN